MQIPVQVFLLSRASLESAILRLAAMVDIRPSVNCQPSSDSAGVERRTKFSGDRILAFTASALRLAASQSFRPVLRESLFEAFRIRCAHLRPFASRQTTPYTASHIPALHECIHLHACDHV